jgi:hypothetical protein
MAASGSGHRQRELAVELAAADAASPNLRIAHRDAIAQHGVTAIDPLLRWVAEGRHPYFAIGVIEVIGHEHGDEALAALRAVAQADPDVVAFARAAVGRLAPSPHATKPLSAPSQRTGTLGPRYAAAAPPHQPCEFPTRRGDPCGNPANYRVDGLWSCSRDHRGNTWRSSSGGAHPAGDVGARPPSPSGRDAAVSAPRASGIPPSAPLVLRREGPLPATADWFSALRPTGPVSRRRLARGVDVLVVPASFPPWVGPPLGMAEDCNKRGGRVIGDAGELSCAEVEIVKSLRRAGWDAAWVSAFRCGERRWGGYRLAPTLLPGWVRDLEARIGLGEAGRPDVVAWTPARVLYLESKGPSDSIKVHQAAWMSAVLMAGLASIEVAVVSWTFSTA